tara:strand:+ start:1506 stop:1940 length:435 start_codon:yes stop_codon:yes gene_type:complete
MKKPKEPVPSGTFALFVVIVLFFGVVGYSMYFDEGIEITKAAVKTIKQFKPISQANSLDKYNVFKDRYDGEEITIRGFLERSVDDKGAYGYFLIDDFGKKIRLEVSGALLEEFPQKGRTDKVFTISGVGRREYEGLVVVVGEIG